MRSFSLLALVAVAAVAACKQGAPNADADQGTATTFSDSTQCLMSKNVVNNPGPLGRDVHITVRNACHSPHETIPARPARVTVIDAAGVPVPNVQMDIAAGATETGLFHLPAGSRLKLDCGGVIAQQWGCYYSYTVIMR